MASPPRAAARRPIGVIDIGSNSIRLVVFDALARTPAVLFNEKVLCGLGKGLEKTGRLNEAGAELALANLKRFALLARAMGARKLRVVATAAVRDADNGHAFVGAIRREAKLPVTVISGEEEARLSALGVVAGTPGADGLMGDLGGGSLELVSLDKGTPGAHATMPFGPLRLRDVAERGRAPLRDLLDRHLGELAWLDRVQGRRFYAVGGAWRALARMHMTHVGYPLRVIHHYSLPRAKAEEFAELIARQSFESLDRGSGVARKRLETLPIAALLLERLLRRARPKELVFSAQGLREGCLHDELPASLRRLDPLLAGAEEAGSRQARFEIDGGALLRWLGPLFARAKAERRLILAACWLSDIAWREHPDYRAEIAFLRILRMPLVGLDHPERSFLALAAFTRYDGTVEGGITRPAFQLLDEERLREAYQLGLALRLAYTLNGGAVALMRRARLSIKGDQLRLTLSARARAMIGEAVERRLDALARAFDRKPVIKAG